MTLPSTQNNMHKTETALDLFYDLIEISEINHSVYRSHLIDVATRFGWILSTEDGKGSHYKLKQDGYQSIIIHSHEYYPSAARQILRRIIHPEIKRITEERYVRDIVNKLEDFLDLLHGQALEIAQKHAEIVYERMQIELQKKRKENDELITLELDALEKLKSSSSVESTHNRELQKRVQELEGILRRIQMWRGLHYGA